MGQCAQSDSVSLQYDDDAASETGRGWTPYGDHGIACLWIPESFGGSCSRGIGAVLYGGLPFFGITITSYDGYAFSPGSSGLQSEVQEALASFESESGYRIENLSMRNQNEGLGYNYPGISHYSSTYDKKGQRFS